ncbi:hypothetical protein CEXT_377151 [Caerostris extrusa]|uniref:Uncharacterized protein n=1 Tax=Caerostris extrusa TaxID=172846 RepID=A0AAV4W0Z4_CAEEX|nr:hypothetical protein CEXT_377151 [Caerostris extrusa]
MITIAKLFRGISRTSNFRIIANLFNDERRKSWPPSRRNKERQTLVVEQGLYRLFRKMKALYGPCKLGLRPRLAQRRVQSGVEDSFATRSCTFRSLEECGWGKGGLSAEDSFL